jgi:broad specificity phosphatase PhoE
MAVTIIFETHSTTFDNENGIASGWNDTRLSPAGLDQAKQLGERYRDMMPDAIFCSDLQRSVRTAMVAFDSLNLTKLFVDWRLRECNYGEMNGADKTMVDNSKSQYLNLPFPGGGESYAQCADRIASFLTDLKTRFDGKSIMIIGHRATQYGLEHWLANKPLEQIVAESWQWQPGWRYTLQ